MKTWEVDVEMRVRKTLFFSGPFDEDTARALIEQLLTGTDLCLWSMQKKESDGASYPMPRPVERIIDNDLQIVAVREVPS